MLGMKNRLFWQLLYLSSIYLPVFPFVRLPVYLSIYLPICLFIHPTCHIRAIMGVKVSLAATVRVATVVLICCTHQGSVRSRLGRRSVQAVVLRGRDSWSDLVVHKPTRHERNKMTPTYEPRDIGRDMYVMGPNIRQALLMLAARASLRLGLSGGRPCCQPKFHKHVA